MRNRILPFFAMAFVAGTASAQWVAPEDPAVSGAAGSEVVSGHVYKLRNVAATQANSETGLFFTGAAVWYSWSTSTALAEADQALPLTVTLTETGWTFARPDGKFTFISGDRDGLGEMHVDMGSQGHNYFDIVRQENGLYRIRAVESDANYGASMPGYENKWWGWEKTEDFSTQYPYAVYATVEDGQYGVDWEFVDLTTYQARMDLYNEYLAADGYNVDMAAYEAVFNNPAATVDEIKEAAANLKEAVAIAKANAILEGATQDNPVDATSLLENPDFEAGNINGWVCTFVKGVNTANVGYMGTTNNGKDWYDEETGESGTAFMTKFIEAWASNTDQYKFNGRTYGTLGDGKLCQTIKGLPAGKYKLSCDANAVQQYEGDANPVTGVQLYANAGGVDCYTSVATGNGIPEHFILTFVHNGGDVELGLRTQDATANWIGADNFTLRYYGPVTDNPYKIILDDYIQSLNAKYGQDIEDIMANKNVKEAYAAKLEQAAQAASDGDDAYYQNLKTELETAAQTLDASIAAYVKIKNTLDEAEARMSDMPDNWSDLADAISDKFSEWTETYTNGEFEAGDEVTINAKLHKMIADFISSAAQPGDDVTILLKNPNFDKDFSGWDKGAGSATPAWGGCKKNPDGDLTGFEDLEQYRQTGIPGGNAEVYHAKFDISQIITNMPKGLYELSCKAFERDENGQVDAELYAVLPDGSEQSVKVMEIKEDLSENPIYQYGQETPDGNNSRELDGGWAPDGMSSANWHFAAGFYKNKFNIVVREPGDIVVGIRTASAGDWVLFDDFKIVYKGSGAAVFEESVMEKIAKLADVLGEYRCSKEVEDAASIAMAEAEESLSSEDDEAPLVALGNLDDMIAKVKASNAAIEHLQYMLEIYSGGYIGDDIVSSDENFDNVLGEVEAALDNGFETEASIEQYLRDLLAAFTVKVQYDLLNATEENPADISAVIFNPNALDPATEENSGIGWEGEPATSNNAFEKYNCNFDVHQTIYGLAPGYYRLKVNGFYRNGSVKDVENAINGLSYDVEEPIIENGDTVKVDGIVQTQTLQKPYLNDKNAKLYAGNAETPLLLISSDVEAYSALEEVSGADFKIGEADYKVPNNMAEASLAFENGLYQNVLQFKVEEGQTEVVIGVKKDDEKASDWAIFSLWQLEYVGTLAPAEDPTTDIQQIGTQTARQTTRIYSVDGQQIGRLQKGVNILKTTLSDGTIKVQKVLVR